MTKSEGVGGIEKSENDEAAGKLSFCVPNHDLQ